jgi:hypothetical protein
MQHTRALSLYYLSVPWLWVFPFKILILEQKFETLNPEEMPIKIQLRLEASRRRVAEFFANTICRLVLQDLGTLMNKYMKRTNEWIIS